MNIERVYFIEGDNGSYFYAEFVEGGSVGIDTVDGSITAEGVELDWTYNQWQEWKNETDEVWGRMLNMPVSELPWYVDGEFDEFWLLNHVGAAFLSN